MKNIMPDSGFIDTHSHIIFGADDGPVDIQTSLKMIEIAYKDGIRKIVATPHLHPEKSRMNYSKMRDNYYILKDTAKSIYKDMELYFGREVFFTSDFMENIEDIRKSTMEDSKYILTEFSVGAECQYIRTAVNDILQKGFIPIIAHIERYENIMGNPDHVVELYNMGAIIQVNAAAVLGEYGRHAKKFVKELLKLQVVQVIATDAHSIGRRKPKMRDSVQYIAKKYGRGYALRLSMDNPLCIIKNQYLEENK